MLRKRLTGMLVASVLMFSLGACGKSPTFTEEANMNTTNETNHAHESEKEALATDVNKDPMPLKKEELISYVDMRFGTATNSLCTIGPTRPNASVNPGPDSYPVNNYSGYYPDKPIRGFTQMHVQAGEGRYGQFLISPQVGLDYSLDRHDSDKANENPTATEYSVTLTKYGIDCSFTPAEHSVIYKFKYPKTDKASIVLDMAHHVPVYGNFMKAENINLTVYDDGNGNAVMEGYGFYKGWGSSNRNIYVYAVINKAPAELGTYIGDELTDTNVLNDVDVDDELVITGTGGYVSFSTEENEEVYMKIAVSFHSCEKAKELLYKEIPAWDYEKVKNETERLWQEELGKILIDSSTDEYNKKMFYTCLYNTHKMPRDRTGEFSEYGDEIMTDDHVATWDTFRTLYPLYSIIDNDFYVKTISSYITRFKKNGVVKDLFATGFERSTGNQGGDNVDNVIAEAYLKGIIPEDMIADAYEIVKYNAENMRLGRIEGAWTTEPKSTYIELEYIPGDGDRRIMCCNAHLEFAYNDYLAAQMALGLGDTENYEKWLSRSDSWQNIWNPDIEYMGMKGFVWPKGADGTWIEPNEKMMTPVQFIGSWVPYFYECTSYEYSFFVPHDIEALIEKMGGEQAFIERLKKGIDNGWINIGNQPGFLQAFLFNYTSEPWRTTDYVSKLLDRFTLDGTPGCEDSGSLSAWYLFATMGIFPCAGQDFYYFTSPRYDQTVFNLENGNTFAIRAENLSEENMYIQSVTLNGESIKSTTIKHSDIMAGGELVFTMGSAPVNYAG